MISDPANARSASLIQEVNVSVAFSLRIWEVRVIDFQIIALANKVLKFFSIADNKCRTFFVVFTNTLCNASRNMLWFFTGTRRQ